MRSFSLINQPFCDQVAAKFRQYSPKLLTILILLFSVAPTYLPGYSSVRPYLTLIPVFYWAVYRPYDFSVFSAFITGLFLDFLDGTPLGVNTLVFTLFYLTTKTHRRYLLGKSFVFVWFGFALFSFGAYFLNGCLFRLITLFLHRSQSLLSVICCCCYVTLWFPGRAPLCIYICWIKKNDYA